ncbi:MAG: glycosyltransferase [Coriobacteriia bacterium]|nr:glycosyltransferase [Coriobacteriia bacterium]
MRSVALITDAPFCRDVRTQRTVEALTEQGLHISVIDQGFHAEESRALLPAQHELFSSPIPRGSVRKFWWHLQNRLTPLRAYRQRTRWLVSTLRSLEADVIHCVNVFGLEAAVTVATETRTPLIYEPLEYWPQYLFSSTYGLSRRLATALERCERDAATTVTQMITVSPVMADNYAARGYRNANVIYNANVPEHGLAQPSEVHTPIRLVHSGYLNRDRNISEIIAACLDNPLVELTVQGEGPCLAAARQQAHGAPNIRFTSLVPYGQTIDSLADYDIGLAGLSPDDDLADYALPNKIFDYLAAGLTIVCTRSRSVASLEDSNAYVRFVDAPTADRFAEAFAELTADPAGLQRRKEAALVASRAYSRTRQKELIKSVYEQIEQVVAS